MKNFIRGCGTGILVATLILAIAYMLTDNTVSDSEIIARAKKLGMVEADETIIKQPQEETTPEVVQQETEVVVTEAPAQEAEQLESTPSEAAQQPESEATQQSDGIDSSESSQSELPTEQNVGETVSVTIKPGQDGITISQMLQEMGVVTDAADFNSYLSKNRLQMNIRHGTFELNKNMSYEELTKKIIY